jgi:hypothetical protein
LRGAVVYNVLPPDLTLNDSNKINFTVQSYGRSKKTSSSTLQHRRTKFAGRVSWTNSWALVDDRPVGMTGFTVFWVRRLRIGNLRAMNNMYIVSR